jgi:hypothetical protein
MTAESAARYQHRAGHCGTILWVPGFLVSGFTAHVGELFNPPPLRLEYGALKSLDVA